MTSRKAEKPIPRERKKPAQKAKLGRPTAYTAKLADAICRKLADGDSLVTVCEAESMPARYTVLRWVASIDEFRDKYVRAREDQAELYAEQIIAISDDASGDYKPSENGPAYDAEHVQRSKLRVDARKWFASKVAPKKYGDKLALGGSDDLPALRVETRLLSDAERAVRLARLLAADQNETHA